MSTRIRILSIAYIISAVLAAPLSGADGFVRAGVGHVDYRGDNDMKATGSKLAPMLAVGALFGSHGSHELAVEYTQSRWMGEYAPLSSLPASELGLTTHGRIEPLLASYRYYLNEGRLRVFAGPSLGAAHATVDMRFNGSGVRWTSQGDEWAFAYAGAAGVAFALTANVGLELGYKYLHVDVIDTVKSWGGAASVASRASAIQANLATLAVSVRF